MVKACPTILIVDDDRVSLSLLSKLVEKLQYNVVQAAGGQQALDIVRSEPIDLIVADYDMPQVDGLTLLKTVKEEFPRLPFILVTAFSNLKVIREAWEFGAFDFFQRPVFVDRLNLTIRLAIEYGHLSIARRKSSKTEESYLDPDLLNNGVVRELAFALEREDLIEIVEEFETHARIELEQVIRFSMAKNHEQVHAIAHRLAGTAINLGLVKLSNELRTIEDRPEVQIGNAGELEQMLEKSIYWLKHSLTQIFQARAS